ncbi:MAG: hypothetical protein WC333_01245 [Dehalococcoidia bacterium]|jgi:hypothetical protein
MAKKVEKKKVVRKTVEQLEQELKELKESNKRSWDMYGSELCVESLLEGERKLEKEIEKAKTIKKWSKLGLLEGLDGNIDQKLAKLFESELKTIIKPEGNECT